LAIRGKLGPFNGALEYRLEPIERGTRVTNEVELRPNGILGVAGQLAGSMIKKAIAVNLGELKRSLESRGGGSGAGSARS
jgi:hypothetical protein